jgi:hypothetical protein
MRINAMSMRDARNVAVAVVLLLAGPVSAATTPTDLFTANCATCHGVTATGGIGPNITCRTDVLATVRNGKATMPPIPSSVLSDADVSAIQDLLRQGCGVDDCGTIDECNTTLAGVLPAAASARSIASRRVILALTRLSRKGQRALAKAATATGPQLRRLHAKARAAFTRLGAVAQAADAKGTLGVPLEPITTVVGRYLTMIWQ